MRYALAVNGVATELAFGQPFIDADGNHNPPENLTFGLDDVQRAARGVLPITPADPAPDGYVIASTALEVVGVVVVETATYEPIPLDDLKAAKLVAAEAVYQAKLSVGYPVTLGGTAQTLQVLTDHDRGNWIGLRIAAREAVDAGNGSAPYPIPIRTTSNAQFSLTCAEALALMTDLQAWVGAMLAARWGVRDAIRAASNAATLATVDLEAGYP